MGESGQPSPSSCTAQELYGEGHRGSPDCTAPGQGHNAPYPLPECPARMMNQKQKHLSPKIHATKQKRPITWLLHTHTHTHTHTHKDTQTLRHARACARMCRRVDARARTHCCETNGQQVSFRVSESSSVGHQTRQSMSDANRRLSAVQGERKRHILHPFTTVSSPRQPRRALSQGPVKDRHKWHLSSTLGCGNVSEPSPQSPCTTFSVNEACGVTSYDQPALFGGVCTGGGKTVGNEDSMHHHWCITHTHCLWGRARTHTHTHDCETNGHNWIRMPEYSSVGLSNKTKHVQPQ